MSAGAEALPDGTPLLVLGAHMTGEPLNGELVVRGARFVADVTTAARYRMYALATDPPKPGLVEVGGDGDGAGGGGGGGGGASLDGELWTLPVGALGAILAALPEPMLLGPVELADGRRVTGFFCQATATADAEDITRFAGWRRFREASAARAR